MSFATADLCDEFGAEVHVAAPLFRNWGGSVRFAGQVETVRVFEDNGLIRQVLETTGRGRVLVIDGAGSLRSALVGGKLAALAHQTGWSGLVVYGCIRDADEIRAIPIGVKALQAMPRRSARSGKGEQGVAVTFAGLTFARGSHLYADGDGIVIAERDLLAP